MSNANLLLSSKVLAFEDQDINSNPIQQNVNWTKNIQNLTVSDVQSQKIEVQPLTIQSIFDNSRSTTLDNTTQLTLTLSTLDSNRYRFTWTGGTNPTFRTDRGLALNTQTLTWAVLANQSVTVTSSTVGAFTAVLVGDIFFVPGISTGDTAGPMNILNEGFWSVLAKDGTSTTLTLVRPTGTSFSAYGQAVTITSNSQVLAYSATGVQVGDTVNISGGFSSTVFKPYGIIAVTSKWFEVYSTVALPTNSVATPGTTGIAFYSNAKRYIRIEADQYCSVRVNGSTDDSHALMPWGAADQSLVAEYVRTGPTWSLTINNKSSSVAQIFLITVQ